MAPTPYTPPDGHIICRLKEVPRKGWEFRYGADSAIWHQVVPPQADSILVEARPVVRQPDPKGVTVDLAELSDTADRCEVRVTSVGEMRGRTDLDQWVCASTVGYWTIWDAADRSHHPDDLPIVVRRVK